jgi:hypothetical protein
MCNYDHEHFPRFMAWIRKTMGNPMTDKTLTVCTDYYKFTTPYKTTIPIRTFLSTLEYTSSTKDTTCLYIPKDIVSYICLFLGNPTYTVNTRCERNRSDWYHIDTHITCLTNIIHQNEVLYQMNQEPIITYLTHVTRNISFYTRRVKMGYLYSTGHKNSLF